jgi:hypothetical protein
MTLEELNALAQLLQRTPLSGAEVQWVNDFLARQREEIAKRAAQAQEVSKLSETPS